MKRDEKQVIIDNLAEQIKAYKHVYISDISELDAAATQALRKVCFESNIKLIQVKNTLLRVALETLDTDYKELFGVLKGSSAVMLSDTGNAPAKPVLKAAFVEECVYVGENQLDALVSIKSKEELLGDIVLLLQSPMQKLISALESGKNTIGGVLKTLEDRE